MARTRLQRGGKQSSATPAQASSPINAGNSSSSNHSSTEGGSKKSQLSPIDPVIDMTGDDPSEKAASPVTQKRRLQPRAPQVKRPKVTPSSNPLERLEQFQTRQVIPGLSVDLAWFNSLHVSSLNEIILAQGWEKLLGESFKSDIPGEIVQFYANMAPSGDGVKSSVNGKIIELTESLLNEILGIPSDGFAGHAKGKHNSPPLPQSSMLTICRRLQKNPSLKEVKPFSQDYLTPLQKLLYNLVRRSILPRAEGRSTVEVLDMVYIDLLENRKKINLSALMIKHMKYVIGVASHGLPYGPLVNLIIAHFNIRMDSDELITSKHSMDSDFLDKLQIRVDGGVLVSLLQLQPPPCSDPLLANIRAIIDEKFALLSVQLASKLDDVVSSLGGRLEKLEHSTSSLAEVVQIIKGPSSSPSPRLPELLVPSSAQILDAGLDTLAGDIATTPAAAPSGSTSAAVHPSP